MRLDLQAFLKAQETNGIQIIYFFYKEYVLEIWRPFHQLNMIKIEFHFIRNKM